MKKISLLIFVFCYSISGYSQDTVRVADNRVHYSNSFASGILFDDADHMSPSMTVINGIKFKQWRAGIGIGLEGYDGWRIFPFFISNSIDLRGKGGGDNSLFLQLNTGYSIGTRTSNADNGWWGGDYSDKGGFMINPMMGYRIVQGKFNFFFAAGYKGQKASYKFVNKDSFWERETKLNFNRFFLQLGFGLH